MPIKLYFGSTLNLCKGSSNNIIPVCLCFGSTLYQCVYVLAQHYTSVFMFWQNIIPMCLCFGSTLYQCVCTNIFMFDEPLQRFSFGSTLYQCVYVLAQHYTNVFVPIYLCLMNLYKGSVLAQHYTNVFVPIYLCLMNLYKGSVLSPFLKGHVLKGLSKGHEINKMNIRQVNISKCLGDQITRYFVTTLM
jgi:hypothetical protein